MPSFFLASLSPFVGIVDIEENFETGRAPCTPIKTSSNPGMATF